MLFYQQKENKSERYLRYRILKITFFFHVIFFSIILFLKFSKISLDEIVVTFNSANSFKVVNISFKELNKKPSLKKKCLNSNKLDKKVLISKEKKILTKSENNLAVNQIPKNLHTNQNEAQKKQKKDIEKIIKKTESSLNKAANKVDIKNKEKKSKVVETKTIDDRTENIVNKIEKQKAEAINSSNNVGEKINKLVFEVQNEVEKNLQIPPGFLKHFPVTVYFDIDFKGIVKNIKFDNNLPLVLKLSIKKAIVKTKFLNIMWGKENVKLIFKPSNL